MVLRHLTVPIRPLSDFRALREIRSALQRWVRTSSPCTPPRRESWAGSPHGAWAFRQCSRRMGGASPRGSRPSRRLGTVDRAPRRPAWPAGSSPCRSLTANWRSTPVSPARPESSRSTTASPMFRHRCVPIRAVRRRGSSWWPDSGHKRTTARSSAPRRAQGSPLGARPGRRRSAHGRDGVAGRLARPRASGFDSWASVGRPGDSRPGPGQRARHQLGRIPPEHTRGDAGRPPGRSHGGCRRGRVGADGRPAIWCPGAMRQPCGTGSGACCSIPSCAGGKARPDAPSSSAGSLWTPSSTRPSPYIRTSWPNAAVSRGAPLAPSRARAASPAPERP